MSALFQTSHIPRNAPRKFKEPSREPAYGGIFVYNFFFISIRFWFSYHNKSGLTNYFNFSLQINDARKRRAVCYDTTKQNLLKGYEECRQPVTLINITEKASFLDPSEQHLIVGKRSRIEPLNKGELTFQYDDTALPEKEIALTTIHNVHLLNENDLATVKGILTLEKESTRDVIMKNGLVVPMLNRCSITDNTGTIRLTLWGDLIKQVSNKKSYSISHIRVKQYDSAKYLTTTPSTTITPIDERFPPPTNELFGSMFDNKTIAVHKTSLAESFRSWLSCIKCQSFLAEAASATTTILKCPNCNAVQPASSCPTNASVRIAVRDSKHELIWLKAFTPSLQEMLNQSSTDVTIHSSEDSVYEQLFDLRNFTLHYSNTSDIIKSVTFNASNNN